MPPRRAGMEQPGFLPHTASQTVELLTLDRSAISQESNTDQDEGSQTDERCPVCGDKVSGYHYGLLTCESCKGFFKRSVQNNKKYTCSEQQRCPVNLSQRKRCPSCRFQKCLAVGMKKEAVRADRMRGGRNKFGPLYRRDRQLKQQRGFHRSNSAPYRIKTETHPMHHHQPLPTAASGFHLVGVHAGALASPEASHHQSHVYSPSGSVQTDTPSPQDYSGNAERVLSPPPQQCHGLYPRAFLPAPLSPGYLQEREAAYGYSSAAAAAAAAANYPLHATPSHLFALHSSPSESPSPSANHVVSPLFLHDPAASPPCALAGSFLGQLLEGEQDESQLCAKVVACLQREQANRGKHDRLNTFSIMCKMADQTLFGLVEWARNSALFKELKVEDQMVLLQSCWSELLVLDHLCRQVTYGKEGCIYLVTGQQIEVSTIVSQAGATLSGLVTRTQDLVSKLKALHFDRHEFVCLKYLVLFNPDVKSVQSRRQVEQTQERVNRALMEHTQHSHSGHSDKFGQLLLRLPEVRSISLQVEEYLYQRHLLGDLPCNSLLTEMLHTKHS